MEGLDAGVVIGIALVAVAELKLCCGFAVGFGNILAAALRMNHKGLIRVSAGFGLI